MCTFFCKNKVVLHTGGFQLKMALSCPASCFTFLVLLMMMVFNPASAIGYGGFQSMPGFFNPFMPVGGFFPGAMPYGYPGFGMSMMSPYGPTMGMPYGINPKIALLSSSNISPLAHTVAKSDLGISSSSFTSIGTNPAAGRLWNSVFGYYEE